MTDYDIPIQPLPSVFIASCIWEIEFEALIFWYPLMAEELLKQIK